jgi:hypothetical protein
MYSFDTAGAEVQKEAEMKEGAGDSKSYNNTTATKSPEEHLRQTLLAITGGSLCVNTSHTETGTRNEASALKSYWMSLLGAGRLTDASLVMSRHLSVLLHYSSSGSGGSVVDSNYYGVSEVKISDEDFTVGGGVSLDFIAAVRTVPASVPMSSLVTWIRADVLPRVDLQQFIPTTTTATATMRTTMMAGGKGTKGAESNTAAHLRGSPVAEQLAAELCHRTRVAEKTQGHPFDAILGAELAVTVCSAISTATASNICPVLTSSDCTTTTTATPVTQEIVQECHRLLRDLHLQSALWSQWGDRLSLEDTAEIGLEGLIFDRLWTVPERGLVGCVKASIEPLVIRFGDHDDVDETLYAWIEETMATQVIANGRTHSHEHEHCNKHGRRLRSSLGGGDESFSSVEEADEAVAENGRQEGTKAADEGSVCQLSRLVLVAGLIQDATCRARALLLLFKVPAVDSFAQTLGAGLTMMEGEGEDEDEGRCDENERCGDEKGGQTTEAVMTVELLCEQAKKVCPRVDAVTAEALTEAIRLQRIKALAAGYGVTSFDPRDKHQIRSVATMMSLAVERPTALKDAVEFASSWGAGTADLTGLFTRAIVHRVLRKPPSASASASASTSASISVPVPGAGSDTVLAADSTSKAVTANSESFADQLGRLDKCIRDCLADVPSSKLLAVVEDTCSCLLLALDDICYVEEETLQSGKTVTVKIGVVSSLQLRREAEVIVSGIVTITSAYLDGVRDEGTRLSGYALTNNNANTTANAYFSKAASNGAGGGSTAGSHVSMPLSSSSTASSASAASKWASSASSSWVNAAFLSYLKRLRSLQTDHQIYLTMSGLKDSSTCKAVAVQLADEHAERLKAYTNSQSQCQSSNGGNARQQSASASDTATESDISSNNVPIDGIEPLTADFRRICALLGVSSIAFVHTVIKKLIARGAPDLAMEVARSLVVDTLTSSHHQSGAVTFTDSTVAARLEPSSASDSMMSAEDAVLLQDAAITLGALSARHIPGPAGRGRAPPRGAPLHAGATGTSGSGSASAVAEPFAISRDILRDITTSCPAEQLPRTLDILNASELVLDVYRRVEGAQPLTGRANSRASNRPLNSEKSDLFADPTMTAGQEFKINESSFSRDGILMVPSIILAPLLKFVVAEVRRRGTLESSVRGENDDESAEIAADVEDLVGVLQRSENNMLAVRVLLGSWHMSSAKTEVQYVIT